MGLPYFPKYSEYFGGYSLVIIIFFPDFSAPETENELKRESDDQMLTEG